MQTRVLVDKGFATDDRIFLGEGLFETLKVDSGKPCCAFLHWQRLSDSARQLGIPFDLSYEDWLEHLTQQIKRDNLYHGGIKAILSGGSAPRGLAAQGQISQLMLQTFNYTVQNTPVRLVCAPWFRDANNPVYQVKSVNYLEAILARRQALALGADDALFFNSDRHATETTCANLFLIQDNRLLTPPIADGVLPGVTRQRMIHLCAQQNISVLETSITKTMINDAEAVIIINSLQGIRAVLSLDDAVFAAEHSMMEQLLLLLNLNELDNAKN